MHGITASFSNQGEFYPAVVFKAKRVKMIDFACHLHEPIS
jgi:hypothetical protein